LNSNKERKESNGAYIHTLSERHLVQQGYDHCERPVDEPGSVSPFPSLPKRITKTNNNTNKIRAKNLKEEKTKGALSNFSDPTKQHNFL